MLLIKLLDLEYSFHTFLKSTLLYWVVEYDNKIKSSSLENIYIKTGGLVLEFQNETLVNKYNRKHLDLSSGIL